MLELTTIQLSPEEALRFVSFQKHYALIKLMESLEAFDIRNGSITIHFDSVGGIGSVDKHIHYRP